MKDSLKMIWELPQNLAGLFVKRFFKTSFKCKFKDALIYNWNLRSGISLGRYIFVHEDAPMETIKHEYGHTIQSKYLGWLYLVVIGLPSIIWCGCFKGYRKKHNISYYDFFTERWANHLGGV